MKKYIKILCLFCSIIICFTSCNKTSEDFVFPKANKTNVISAELVHCGNTVEEMYNNSGIVAIGNIIENGILEPEYYDSKLYAKFELTKVFKGEFEKGDVITVNEYGDISNNGDFGIDGVPLLKKGMKVLLFLSEPYNLSKGNKPEVCYIMGAVAGKFFIDSSGNIHPSQEFTEIETYNVSDISQTITQDIFLNILNESQKTK